MDLVVGEYPLHAIINQVLVDRRQCLEKKGVLLDLWIIRGGRQSLLKHLESANITTITSDKLMESWEEIDRKAAEKVKSLLNDGTNINAMNEVGITPLRLALDSGNTEMAAVLLEHGADMTAGKQDGSSMLHVAVRSGNKEMVQLLLDRGADLSATDGNGSSTLHIAVKSGNVEMVQLLLEKDADITAKEEDGSTVLHVAVSSRNSKMLKLLLDHGAALGARDENNKTALHIAACYRNSTMVKFLLGRGADVAAKDKTGRTALHFAVCFSNTTMISMLLSRGAKVDALDKAGNNPLGNMISAQQHELDNESIAVAHLLCSRGSKPMLSASVQSSLRDHQLGLLECARYWHECFEKSKSLVNVSSTFIKAGATAVRTYFDELENTSDGDIVKRCKLCVIGPSTWGKTSFVKSVTEGARFVVNQDDRTVGIDRFSFTFKAEEERYDITFWDHAGQDIYQVSNPLFFSEKTVYLLCVDFGVYAEKLVEMVALPMVNGEEFMSRFFEVNVLHWLRLVLLRQPDARFKLIGTKSDLVSEESRGRISRDVNTRLISFLNNPARQVVLDDCALKALRKDFDRFLTPTSAATTDSALEAQQMIKLMIVGEPSISFPMPKLYTQVLENIVKLQRLVMTYVEREDQLENLMLPVTVACTRLMEAVPGLTGRVCRDILTALHNLGDILWYKDGNNENDDRIFLDPTIVLDIIREVVNHEHEGRVGGNYDALRRDGTLHHSLLMTFPLWKKLQSCDERMVPGFKHLLLRFNLAYPANKGTILEIADMIVPSFCLRESALRRPLSRQGSVLARHYIHTGHIAKWKYTLPVSVSKAIFMKFAVRSYRPDATRQISGNRFECFADGEFAAAIYLTAREEQLYDEILIEVAATTKDIAWTEMRFFVVAMEQVLHEYPGLTSSEDNTEMQRHVDPDGDEYWHSLNFEIGNGVTEEQLRRMHTWLPPDFRWFIEKAWTIPGRLNELEVSRKLTVLKKLIIDREKRRFPAVWTLSYPENSETIEIRIHSDISGKCFHKPLQINTFERFVADNSAFIQAGISALSIATAAIPFAVASTAVGVTLSASSEWVNSTCTAQSILEKANLIPGTAVSSSNPSMSSSARMAFLLKLLEQLGYSELSIPDAANLQCTTTEDGSYVWLHPSETSALQSYLTPYQGKTSAALCSTTEGRVEWFSNPEVHVLKKVDTLVTLKDCTLKIRLRQARQFTGYFRTDKDLGCGEGEFTQLQTDDFSSRTISLRIPVSLHGQTQHSPSPSVTCEVSIKLPTINDANVEDSDAWLYPSEMPALQSYLTPCASISRQFISADDLHKDTFKGSRKQDRDTALHVAITSRDTTMLKGLLDEEGVLNARDKNGWTPLHVAARYGYVETVELLLSRGASVSALSKDNSTPLHFAACCNSLEVVALLLKGGADVNAVDKAGNNPLSRMIFDPVKNLDDERRAVARLLCSQGSEPKLPTSDLSSLDHQSGLLQSTPYWNKKG
ncbi:putative ankyrin repeat protein [Phytophthora ramorum]|uniref:putative ankyrin repeat protein n=1 Tax=Phytophthora ramorum TaxID=164328 RepID=UPI0030A20949|nr:putative ankyrin repeat protein [Phytophthora ramorum]